MLDRLLDARRAALGIVACALLAGGLAMWSDLAQSLNRMIEPLRFAMVHRPATGKVVVVEMDATSAATIRRWPWSRTNYAIVVDRLRAAGAGAIVFDVEFSSPSDAVGDTAFAAALQRADGLVALPTFGQQASSDDQRTLDALPIPVLRRHVALASVSVAPDADGVVRAMPFGTITAGVPRPSLSAYIASRSGEAGRTFPIDMSIDPATIPRLSFVAVRDGRFDPALVRGRSVLIGATAIEMGDRYGTVGWGVIPGVLVQALAAETLLRGVPVRGSDLLVLILAAGLAAVIAKARQQRSALLRMLGAIVVLVAAVCVAQQAFYVFLPLASGLIVLATAAMLSSGRLLLRQLRELRLIDEASGLPNRRAMTAALEGDGGIAIAVLRIANLESIVAVLGSAAKTDAIGRVADRARLIGVDAAVYRITEQALAFALPDDRPVDELFDGFRAVMLQPVEIAGRRIDVMATVGIAGGSAGRGDALLDAAMRAAEAALADGVFWQRAETDVDALERSITLMGELDAALADGQITVFYQPKLDLRADRIASAEALIRWPHPDRGFIAPDLFIPMAEQTNRIAPLTRYVLAQAIADQHRLRAAGQTLTIAVNISAKLLESTAFVAEVETVLAGAGLPASTLVFEVTESAAMAHPEAAVAALERFRALGVAISMDDYGTGQSTLTYLRGLPLNELKIDRSFVQHAHRNHSDGLLVRSTIDLAHDMGLKVVAEGVEEADCLAYLRSIGCDLVQGYFVSRPLPLDELQTFVERQRDVPAATVPKTGAGAG